jgi:preprotein translocase subunit SecE
MSKKETDEGEELETEREERDSVDDAADADVADDSARADSDDDADDDDADDSLPTDASGGGDGDDGDDDDADDDESADEGAPRDESASGVAASLPTDESEVPTHLGAAQKYVHAAFFGAGILVAYLSGKILQAAWNELAEWPTAVRAVPALLRFAEDDRANYTLMAGAVIGIISVIQTYRKEKIRQWANDVAGELAKVTWPTKDIVTNGTVVVVIATLISTTYIGLLDRLWGFLTNLVYGA